MHHPRVWVIPAYLHYLEPPTPSITSPPRQETGHGAAREIDMPLAPVVGYRQRDNIRRGVRKQRHASPLKPSPAQPELTSPKGDGDKANRAEIRRATDTLNSCIIPLFWCSYSYFPPPLHPVPPPGTPTPVAFYQRRLPLYFSSLPVPYISPKQTPTPLPTSSFPPP